MLFLKKHKAIFLISFGLVEMMQDVILYAKNIQQAHILVTEWTKEFRHVDELFRIAFSSKFADFDQRFSEIRKEFEQTYYKGNQKVYELCLAFRNKSYNFRDDVRMDYVNEKGKVNKPRRSVF